MIVEALRIVADWLGDATHGVNDKLAALEVDAGDEVPAVATITDETRNGEAARKRPATPLPSISAHFHAGDRVTVDATGTTRTGVVTVFLRYNARNVDTEEGGRDAYYTLRAALQSLRVLEQDTHASSRTRNGVRLEAIDKTEYGQLFAPAEDAPLAAGLLVTWQFTDIAP